MPNATLLDTEASLHRNFTFEGASASGGWAQDYVGNDAVQDSANWLKKLKKIVHFQSNSYPAWRHYFVPLPFKCDYFTYECENP